MQSKTVLSIIVLISIFAHLSWTRPQKSEVITRFSAFAIEEMHMYGIPASIKIAQAIVETNWGQSPLALHANNYFGIKCKETWDGPTFMHPDDDRDAKGKIIPSCFRAYDGMQSSFRDHSIFLSTRRYYTDLFKLSKTDYIGWAHGLKKSGYASDPKYAQKLIMVIEQYDLAMFDHAEP
jgi:flagellum-specific peptidoglycan hydrolase FlgJ